MFSIPWLQFSPLISLVFTMGLGLIVLKKNPHSVVNRLFFLISFGLAFWLFGTFMMDIGHSDEGIIFWDRFIYLGVVFMPSLEYHFSLALTGMNRLRKALLYLGYLLSFIFLGISRTDFFISGVFRYRWGAHSIAHIGHHLFLAFFFYYVFAIIYNFFKQYRKSALKIERQRLVFLIFAFMFLNLIGGIAYLPAYRFAIFTPIALLAPWGYSILVGYAIVVHRLMDINLVIRRYLVYLASFVTVVCLSYELKRILYHFYAGYGSVIDALVIVAAILAFSKTKKYFFKKANQYFFTSLYDSHKVITEINDKLRSTLDINKIYVFVQEALAHTFRSDSFAVLSLNSKKGVYVINYNKGFDFVKNRNVTLSEPLQEIFANRDKTVYLDDAGNLEANPGIMPVIRELREMNVEMITPLKIENRISGLIFLGPKKTGDLYTKEDMEVLDNVSTSIAMAVNNAVLHEDALAIADEMNKQAKKISAVLSNFVDPIIFIDKYGCLGMVNPSAESILGIRRRDIGKELGSLKWKNDELKKIICENNVQTFGKIADDPAGLKEIFLMQGDEQIYYKVLSTEVVSDSEDFIGTLKIFYNLTKEKALDRSKSEFLSVAAHQLRTPLSAVKWIIESFINKELGEVTPDQKQYLDMASISNQKMITMVNEFLNVSKIEAGSLIYDFQACDVKEVIDGVRVDVENIAKNKKIRLIFTLEENLPKIMADKRKIFIVIENLISNAINYTPESGKILVDVKKQDENVIISVKDNGIGIPKKELEKIFTKFFRASNAVRVQPDGSGLGLFIIKNIVKIHKGDVIIESEEGVGTKFIVKLPAIIEK